MNYKKLFLICVLILFLSAIGIFILLNSHTFGERIIPQLLTGKSKDVSITKIEIARQTFNLRGLLTLRDVSLQLQSKEDTFEVSFDLIEVKFHRLFSKQNARIFVNLQGVNINSEFLKLANAKVILEMLPSGLIEDGKFSGKKLKYLAYELTNITGDIISDKQFFRIHGVKADFYGGKLQTEARLAYDPQFNYNVTINLKSVNIKQLEESNKAVFSNARGLVDGDIKITGADNKDYEVQGKITSVSDMEVKVSLIRPLLEYIPQSQQKKDLDLLVKQQGNVPLELAEITLLSVTDEMIKTRVELKSKKFNLDIGADLDFNIEGGVQNFLNLQKQYFIKKR